MAQRGDRCVLGIVCVLELVQHRLGSGVVRLARQREFQIVGEIVVTRIDHCIIRQFRDLPREGVVEVDRVPAVVAIAGPGIEHGIAADKDWLIRVG